MMIEEIEAPVKHNRKWQQRNAATAA